MPGSNRLSCLLRCTRIAKGDRLSIMTDQEGTVQIAILRRHVGPSVVRRLAGAGMRGGSAFRPVPAVLEG